jgi:hypothetical protein
MNKKILSLVVLTAVLALPLLAQAKSVADLINTAAGSLTAASAGLAIIAFMVAGIMFLSASGNPSRLAIAKGSLIAAVTGIVIVVLAATAQTFVKTFFGL